MMSTENHENGNGYPREEVAAGHPDDQLLVAYLDGELDTEAAGELEERLSADGDLRQKLAGLQQSWDLLDDLPRTQSNEAFVRSTIEMVVSSAYPRRRRWHRWPIRVAAAMGIFVIGALAAYQLIRFQQMEPHREFVAELDFIENIDQYAEINDIEFLEKLLEQDLFGEELASDQ